MVLVRRKRNSPDRVNFSFAGGGSGKPELRTLFYIPFFSIIINCMYMAEVHLHACIMHYCTFFPVSCSSRAQEMHFFQCTVVLVQWLCNGSSKTDPLHKLAT